MQTARLAFLIASCLLPWTVLAPLAAEGNPFLPEGTPDLGWPSVRGVNHDGHSPEINLADSWPPEGPPVLWVRDLGQGYSAFVAKEDSVYTLAQSLQGQFVYCLDARTGETRWRYRYDWPYEIAGVYPGPRATPTLADGKVLFASPAGLIGCLDERTGHQVWSRNVVTDFSGDGGTGFGYSCSPTVVDDLVLLPVGGPGASLVALDLQTGKTVWQSGDEPGSYSPAMPITRGGRDLVVGYLENALVIHDLRTGELLSHMELSHGYDEHSAWPIYREPLLWIAAPFQAGSQLLEISDDFTQTAIPKTVWRSKTLSNDVLSSVLVDGALYGFDIFDPQAKTQRPSRGKFRCVDFLTGEELWEQGSGKPQRSNNDISEELGQSGIVVADGKLILFNERGELILLRPNRERCDIQARCGVLTGELTWTPPSLHRGCIYVRNHSRAACIYIGESHLLPKDQTTLSAAQIPQSAYADWSTRIVPVEPEFAFDLPSDEWLWSWYLWTLALLGASLVLAAIPALFAPTDRRWFTWIICYRTLAFLLGAGGTTWLSFWTQEFLFTWPLCLFISFEIVLANLRQQSTGRAAGFRDRLPLFVFVAVSLFYYWLCRRMSLVFEWAFLLGPIGAMLPGLIEWRWQPRGSIQLAGWVLLKLLTFTCFWGTAIVVFRLRY
ncbi:outer membrane protein assembly factor BamB family protein [Rubinisphaera margarita]|uniref:outer membrane protein assembly factor BamB family protein n=1 Tax=Rubinisphaera margarita TaxID=2909586 RepID=UPI001EE951C8|nr:PQQ-binding-like beta-propeller repeat protein [Rubinisphaera margarita]MCG6154231.1 PQQ-binding-like beta-propeller repeat protein [Rubinisphaera margarita]